MSGNKPRRFDTFPAPFLAAWTAAVHNPGKEQLIHAYCERGKALAYQKLSRRISLSTRWFTAHPLSEAAKGKQVICKAIATEQPGYFRVYLVAKELFAQELLECLKK